MAPDRYDVIVIGARCAGSPTAMLLARQGHRVLLVDRATFPSDTLSTHVVHPPGVAALDRWGAARPTARDQLPAHRHVQLRLRTVHDRRAPGDSGLAGRLLPRGGRCSTSSSSTRPRRAASRSARPSPSTRSSSTTGASPASVGTTPGGGARRRARQRGGGRRRPFLVAGEGGRPRAVPRTQPDPLRVLLVLERPPGRRLLRGVRPARSTAGRWRRPTTTSRWSSPAGRIASATTNKHDVEGTYLRMFDLAPEFAERIRGATRESRHRRHRGRRTTSASRSDRAGRSSATPGTTRTSSPRRASPTRSGTPSCAPTRSTRRFSGAATVRRGDGRVPGHARRARRCPCSSSPASSRPSSRRRPRCNSSSARCTATRTRWTGSHG